MQQGAPFLISVRFHWPMQGPQALASTVPPTRLNTSMRPSRSMVARICSLPGVIVKGTCTPKVQPQGAWMMFSRFEVAVGMTHNLTRLQPPSIALSGYDPELLEHSRLRLAAKSLHH